MLSSLGASGHLVVRRTNVVPFHRALVRAGESHLLALVDGAATVRGIVETSGMPSDEAIVHLRALVIRHLVRLEEPAAKASLAHARS